MSCGVCGRICTLAWVTDLETVAWGLSSGDLYSGPKCWLGARSSASPVGGERSLAMFKLVEVELVANEVH